ncbi:MAG: hypothetical protein WCD89_19225 [Anaerocolumna sp.]
MKIRSRLDAKSAREFVELDIRGKSELKLSVINAGDGNKSDALANCCEAALCFLHN